MQTLLVLVLLASLIWLTLREIKKFTATIAADKAAGTAGPTRTQIVEEFLPLLVFWLIWALTVLDQTKDALHSAAPSLVH